MSRGLMKKDQVSNSAEYVAISCQKYPGNCLKVSSKVCFCVAWTTVTLCKLVSFVVIGILIPLPLDRALFIFVLS